MSEKIESLRSTYRVQLHKDFQFRDTIRITRYLEDMGYSHLYLSPILDSKPGSNHGYDGTDPTHISDERGGEKGFVELIERVRKSEILRGVILDIVPNHLAASPLNPAWRDMLKFGRESKHWKTFDVKSSGRIVLPVLGRHRQGAVAAKEITLGVEGSELVFRYYEHHYPVAPKSYRGILQALGEKVAPKEVLISSSTTAAFATWTAKNPKDAKKLEAQLKNLPLRVIELALEEQAYVLRDWRSGNRDINYRRFFDINELAGLRIEDESVYDWAHGKVFDLLKKYPEIHGLRIDHVDGLTDPDQYLQRLNKLSTHVWVEKILGHGENLPEHWPVAGSTGYEFSNTSARLFVDLPGLLHLHSHYLRSIDNRWERFHDCVYESKREMMESHFASEVNYLVDQFYRLAQKTTAEMSFSRDDLHEAMIELTSSLSVYRTYAVRGEAIRSPWLTKALAETESRGKLTNKAAFEWLRTLLLAPGDWSEEAYLQIKRWEQLTGPVMAKGLEDTALYRYCPLLSLNVVGGEPDWIGDGSLEFHSFNQNQLRTRPLTLCTTSTHDTKRSEDVRSRIHIISELHNEWVRQYQLWLKSSEESKTPLSVRIRYLIFETLVGAWPTDGKVTDDFIARMKQYFTKAAREAKTETSWSEPNAPYEEALLKYVETVLRPRTPKGRALFKSLQAFAAKCAYFGALNSLSMVTLKATSPGLPDFYQGCDMWDLSLVDPDNRRPVDYALREKLVKGMIADLKKNPRAYHEKILSRWKTGEVKLWLTREMLQLRRQHADLFLKGEYLAIEPQGEGRSQFISFTRQLDGQWIFVVVPRFMARSKVSARLEISDRKALKTTFQLPPQAPMKWRNQLTGEVRVGTTFTGLDAVSGLPVGVWLSI